MTQRARRRLIPTESQEQSVVIQWWASYSATKGIDERLLMSIPNGAVLAGDARRRAIQMAKLKRTGLRVGAPDLILAMRKVSTKSHDEPYPAYLVLFYGLFIEMKRKGEKASEEQIEFASVLRKAGYMALICVGADEAIRALKEYIES